MRSQAWAQWDGHMKQGAQILFNLSYHRFKRAQQNQNDPDYSDLLMEASFYAKMGGLHKMGYWFTNALYDHEAIDDLQILESRNTLSDNEFMEKMPCPATDNFRFENVIQNAFYSAQEIYQDPWNRTNGKAEQALEGAVTTRKLIHDAYQVPEFKMLLYPVEHMAAYNATLQISHVLSTNSDPNHELVLLHQLGAIECFFRDNNFSEVRAKIPVEDNPIAQGIADRAASCYLRPVLSGYRMN